MKNLIVFAVVMSTIFFTSCDKVEYIEPTFTTISNTGLPSIKSNEYFIAEVETSTKLAVGTKITKGTYQFNIAEYNSGMLELKFHQVCMNMTNESYISCSSFRFLKFTIQKCN